MFDTHKHARGQTDAHVWKTFKKLLPLFLMMSGVIFFRQFMKSGVNNICYPLILVISKTRNIGLA